jgi:hypothetical protein
LSFSTGDVIVQKFESFENTVTFSVRNKTTNSAWISATYTFVDTETKYSAGYVTIGSGIEADYYINSLKVSSREIKNPDVYLLGDSKFTKSTYQNQSFVGLLKNNFGVVVANTDPGGTSTDGVAQLWMVTNYIKPKMVVYANSNDERYGRSNASWQADYDTIYNRLGRSGIPVKFISFPETSTPQTDVVTYLDANYPTQFIKRPYTVLSGLNTTDYLLSDGIHLNANGNLIAFKETLLDGKILTSFVDKGTYTPTLTNVANVTGSTAYLFKWSRVNDIVTVSGEVDIDPTTTVTLTRLGISLPLGISSLIADTFDISGTSADDLGTAARVAGDATNDRAEVRMTPVDVSNRRFSVIFQFRVL